MGARTLFLALEVRPPDLMITIITVLPFESGLIIHATINLTERSFFPLHQSYLSDRRNRRR